MAFSFTCPQCGTKTVVADEFAGQSGPCVGCGQTVTVPPRPDTPGYTTPQGGGSQAWALVVVVVIVGVLFIVFCLGIGGFFFFARSSMAPAPMPATAVATAPVMANQCSTNLQAIGAALEAYRQDKGTYPPAYIADADGKPMHSWRVLLLPYLGQQTLFNLYRMDEPWDGPNNMALHNQLVAVYRCPMIGGNLQNTNYVMVVGKGMLSDGAGTTKADDIKDGLANTIAVVETPDIGITWCEPRDLEADKIDLASAGSLNEFRGNGQGRFLAVMCDGAVVSLSSGTPGNELKPLLTIAGGEPTSRVPRYAPEH